MYGSQPQYYQQPASAQSYPQKRNAKLLVSAIFCIIALGLIIAVLMMPWWTVKYTVDNFIGTDLNAKQEYGATTVRTSGTLQGWGNSSSDETKTYSSLNDDFVKRYGVNSTVISLFNTVYMLSLIAIMLIILSTVFILLAYSGKIKPFIALALVFVAFIVVLAAAVLFAFQLPGAWETDYKVIGTDNQFPNFMGSKTQTSGELKSVVEWGPGIGWYLMLVTMIMLLIGSSFIPTRNPPSPAVAQQPAPPQTQVYSPQAHYAFSPGAQGAQPHYQPVQPVQPRQ